MMPMLFDCQRYLISPGDKLFVAYRLFRTSVLLAAYCFASLDDVTFSFNLIQQCVCVCFLFGCRFRLVVPHCTK